MILVVPEISTNVEIFGIYAFIMTLSLYFTYADIGFVSAGQKYAAEAYAKSDLNTESKTIGFIAAVLLSMFLPVSLLFAYLHNRPGLVFDELSPLGVDVAGNLLLAIALLVPIQVILQRCVSIIFAVRLLDFIVVRIEIFFNVIKIASIFYFFRQDDYRITEYYVFGALLAIFGYLICFIYVINRLDFDFKKFVKSIRWSKLYYNKTKKLAFASAAITVGFVLYYELDLVLVGYLFSVKDVAFYAVAFTLMGFLRRLWSILYGPVSVRLNHFVGLNRHGEMADFIYRLIYYSFPMCIIVTMTLIFSAESLVLAWVGSEYVASIPLLQILLLSFSGSYLTNLGFHYSIATERSRVLYLLSIILPLVFLNVVYFFYQYIGIIVIPYAKLTVMIFHFCIYWYVLRVVICPFSPIKKWIVPSVVWGVLAMFFLHPMIASLGIEESKSSGSLIKLVVVIAIFIGLSYTSFFLIFKQDRQKLFDLASVLIEKSKTLFRV